MVDPIDPIVEPVSEEVDGQKPVEGAPTEENKILGEVDLTDESMVEEADDDFFEKEWNKAMGESTDDDPPAVEPVAEPVVAPVEPKPAEPKEQDPAPVAEPTEPKPAEPAAEEEPQLPDFMKKFDGEVDLENEALVEAIDFWAGGPRADWTRTVVSNMPEDKQAVFKSVQSAYDKTEAEKSAQPAPATPQPGVPFSQEEKDGAMADLAKLIQGDPAVAAKYRDIASQKQETKTPASQGPIVDDDLVAKFGEAVDSGDKEQITSVFKDVLTDVVEKTTDRVRNEAVTDAVKSVSEQQKEQREMEMVHGWEKEAATLARSDGSAFTKHMDSGAIQELLVIGHDPITRAPIKSPQDAYEVCLNRETHGQSVVPRPSPAARSSQPATEVTEPTTLADLEAKMDSMSGDDYIDEAARISGLIQ